MLTRSFAVRMIEEGLEANVNQKGCSEEYLVVIGPCLPISFLS